MTKLDQTLCVVDGRIGAPYVGLLPASSNKLSKIAWHHFVDIMGMQIITLRNIAFWGYHHMFTIT